MRKKQTPEVILNKRKRDAKLSLVLFLIWPTIVLAIFYIGSWFQIKTWFGFYAGFVYYGSLVFFPLAIYCAIAYQFARRNLMMTKIQLSLANIAEQLKHTKDDA